MKTPTRFCLLVLLLTCVAVPATRGQEDPQLEAKQAALSSRYARFEKLLLQMAEYLGRTDPDRAELLMRALSRSREERISTRMNGIVELLRDEEFDDALQGQEQLVTNLRTLLELLQSEDRRSELEEESARIKALLKDVNRLIGDQKIARATTARSGKPADAIKSQQRVKDKTGRIVDRLKAQDAQQSKGAQGQDGNPSDPESGDPRDPKDPSKQKDPDGKNEPKDGDPGKSDGKPEDKNGKGAKDSESGQPGQQSQSGQGQPGKGQSGQGQSDQDKQQPPEQKTPGREELEKARDAMQRAIEELRKDQQQESTQEQDKALEKLLAAREKLEEKLRQLREEERELMLAALEARFQKMLAMQLLVNSGTTTLAGTDQKEWLDRDFTRSRQLAQMENEIGIEASRALTVLKEEGTSVSFPLAVEDVREDILIVARYLEDARVGELTQEIQADIVEALGEMVLALQKEMEKSDEQKGQQQPPGGPQNADGDPVLVDLIAELKMLRTLQKRVNRRTRQIGREIDGDQANRPDLVEQLEKLANRQERIRQTAIDIAKTRKEK